VLPSPKSQEYDAIGPSASEDALASNVHVNSTHELTTNDATGGDEGRRARRSSTENVTGAVVVPLR
jgi:hypothetical protein